MTTTTDTAEVTEVTALTPADLLPCAEEDSDNCYWNAWERVNGEGQSFYVIDGQYTYCAPDQIFAEDLSCVSPDFYLTPEEKAEFEVPVDAGVDEEAEVEETTPEVTQGPAEEPTETVQVISSATETTELALTGPIDATLGLLIGTLLVVLGALAARKAALR